MIHLLVTTYLIRHFCTFVETHVDKNETINSTCICLFRDTLLLLIKYMLTVDYRFDVPIVACKVLELTILPFCIPAQKIITCKSINS